MPKEHLKVERGYVDLCIGEMLLVMELKLSLLLVRQLVGCGWGSLVLEGKGGPEENDIRHVIRRA